MSLGTAPQKFGVEIGACGAGPSPARSTDAERGRHSELTGPGTARLGQNSTPHLWGAVPSDPYPTRHLFGIPIHALTMGQVLSLVDEAIERRSRLHIGVVNAAKVVNMRRDEHLRRAVMASDLILADGMSVVLAARLLGRRLPERIAGIDLMMGMLRRGGQRGYRIFCLGATREVLAEVVRQMEQGHPGLRVVGSHHGYYTAEEEPAVAGEIAAARPDILFVAMTSPKKEEFLARWSATLDVPVCHGVGGAFDVLAGKVKRAPVLWQRLGMEWFYRVLQEPRRMWRRYLVTNSLFSLMVVRELLAGRYEDQPTGRGAGAEQVPKVRA